MIVAVIVTTSLGAMVSVVVGEKSTFQFVGAVADIVTLVTGAVPVLVMVNCWVVAVPAVPCVDRVWLGVESVSL